MDLKNVIKLLVLIIILILIFSIIVFSLWLIAWINLDDNQVSYINNILNNE